MWPGREGVGSTGNSTGGSCSKVPEPFPQLEIGVWGSEDSIGPRRLLLDLA